MTPHFQDLGCIEYQEAYRLQIDLHDRVLNQQQPPTILLLEHPPVITISKRKAAKSHLLTAESHLQSLGIDVQPTDRGGDITYHGPGQLVAYPILPLAPLCLNIRRYIALLEDVLISILAQLNIPATRHEAGIGVWVEDRKIAAIGVRVKKWVSLHGIALNVTTNLDHYQHIVPCGLTQRVTSIQEILGHDTPTMSHIKEITRQTFQDALSNVPKSITP